MQRWFLSSGSALVLVLAAQSAAAEEASASLSLSTDSGASASSSADDLPYLQRYKPEPMLFELGFFAGVFFPSSDHNLHRERLPHAPYDDVAPAVGGRIGFYPLSYLGIEGEGEVMFADTAAGDDAGFWAARAHLVGQLPYWSVTPFVVLGVGRLGAGSNEMGADDDPALHFGAGVKVPIDDVVGVRLDIRDNLSQKNDASDGTLTHHPEVLFGLSLTLDRSGDERGKPQPLDRDADGFPDDADACPQEVGAAPDGCPPSNDADADGIADADDRCPQVAGVAPDGCPVDPDPDKDGIPVPQDACPEQAGIAPDGCPDLDPDKDGIRDPDDRCPDKPETKNGYQDGDGCPDEVPEKIKSFTGVLEGIEFALGKADIRPQSKPVLDKAVAVLKEFPSVRILITGHTDDQGDAEKNVTLSKDRAASVKQYLVDQGVAANRVETRGAGPNEPIADNKTYVGRQKNRRIEFKLITDGGGAAPPAKKR